MTTDFTHRYYQELQRNSLAFKPVKCALLSRHPKLDSFGNPMYDENGPVIVEDYESWAGNFTIDGAQCFALYMKEQWDDHRFYISAIGTDDLQLMYRNIPSREEAMRIFDSVTDGMSQEELVQILGFGWD